MTDSAGVDGAIRREDPLGMGQENTFSGVLSLFRRKYAPDPAGADVAITGIPYDLAVTNRPGTRFGPRAIRAASAQVSWPGGGWPYRGDPFARLRAVDTGDLGIDFGYPDRIPEAIRAHAAKLIASGPSLVSLGGDHYITYPLLQAHAERHGPLALVQFDSHSDTWREPEKRIDHGTMFFHAISEGVLAPERSVQVGIRTGNPERHGITVLDVDWVQERTPAEVAARIREVVGAGPAYLTFDIDCLDPAFAPGTGTPVCGGLSTWQARRILGGLGPIDFVGMDLVEVSPPYDQSDVTALAAAHLILDYICLRAAKLEDDPAGS